MNVVLLLDIDDPHQLRKTLAADFPQINFYAGKKKAEVEDRLETADVLVALAPSNSVISRARNLKWLHALTAGTDHIEMLPSFQARKDIIFTSSRGMHGPQMSELAIMFMIALNRKFPQNVRNQDRHKWKRWPTQLLWKKRVGILGLGVIGKALARKCKAFEMSVVGFGSTMRAVEEVDEFYLLESLPDIVPQLDYFVCVAPLTPRYHKLLDAGFFACLKSTAYFINIGRGAVVDEDALVNVLQEKKIAGAALDCFFEEPLPENSPLWDLENIIITPHVGGVSDIYLQQALPFLMENLKRFLAGERKDLLNFIDRD